MQTPLVSIILPTYNVASFLKQCLDSISAQTYTNYEVIIVVDGATDGSYEIAKDYCKNHEKFSVYWQENAGSGPARNAGLAKAQGELVMFVDPDDWIEPDLLEQLVSAQNQDNADLVVSKRIRSLCDNGGNLLSFSKSCFKDELISNQQNVRRSYFRLLNMGAVSAPTEKLYKISIIRGNDIKFPALRRSQDVAFNCLYYNYVSSIKIISYRGYNYRVLLENSSGRSPEDYYKTIVYLYQTMKQMHERWNIHFENEKFCTYFFEMRLVPNLQRCVIEHWNMAPIVEDETINFIVKNAKLVKAVSKRIARFFILKRKYWMLAILLKVIVLFKQKGVAK